MSTLLFYIATATVIAGIYKFGAFLISGILALILGFILKINVNELDEVFVKHPKKFYLYGTILNATIGVIYSLIIAYTTYYFIFNYGGNYWLYVILSLLWGFTIIFKAETYHSVLLSSCLGSLILLYLGLGIWGMVTVWLVTIVGFYAYFAGGINMLNEYENFYEEKFNTFNK